MYPSDIVSVSDLRTKTKSIFGRLKSPKCIVINNKPAAILMNIGQYQDYLKQQEERHTVVDFWNEWIDPRKLLEVHENL